MRAALLCLRAAALAHRQRQHNHPARPQNSHAPGTSRCRVDPAPRRTLPLTSRRPRFIAVLALYTTTHHTHIIVFASRGSVIQETRPISGFFNTAGAQPTLRPACGAWTGAYHCRLPGTQGVPATRLFRRPGCSRYAALSSLWSL
jgi:hypothetical protein